MIRRSEWPALAVLLAVVPYFLLVVNRPGQPGGMIAFDIYNYYYPNMLYALQALRRGGDGLWWDGLLNCGQRFFGNSSTGLLHPASVFWLMLQPETALRAVIGFNLVVAGVSAYALCRMLGAASLAALCGALAFQLSNSTVGFSMWDPQGTSAYVLIPAALLGCERLLQRPSFGRALFLSAVLVIMLLPGRPQVVLFAYQLLALRVLWEFATRRVAQPMRTILWVGLGLLLPPLLVAVQFLPGLEVANLSVRNAALGGRELAPEGFLNLAVYRRAASMRRSPVNPLILVPCIVSIAALWSPTTRRSSLFYLAAGLLYFVLAFGPNTPLFEAYARLPFGSLFRHPTRFMWVPGFCLAVLTALGAQALLSCSGSRATVVRAGTAVAGAAVAIGYHFLLPRGFLHSEWLLAGVAVAASTTAIFTPTTRRWAGLVVLGALLTNVLLIHRATILRLLTDDRLLYAHQHDFEALKQQMTPQDRVYLIPGRMDPSLEQKTTSLFDIPGIHDYEPLPTQRYAEFFVMLRTGRELQNLNQFYYPLTGYTPVGFKRRLLDLAAGRYVVAASATDETATGVHPPLRLLTSSAQLRMYENPQALPRAFYVPRVEVVASAPALLRRLADGTDDLHHLALVEELPPSAFTGTEDSGAAGRAEFIRNDPEHIVIRVQAPAPGFLFLGDQHFPGWHATVNGAPAPILRANYLFRLVEVREGESVIEFRYAPRSLWIGASVSVLTIAGVGVATLLRARRTHRGSRSAALPLGSTA